MFYSPYCQAFYLTFTDWTWFHQDKQDPTRWQGNIAIVGVNIHSYEYIFTLIYLCISPKQLVQQMVGDYLSFFQLITHAVNFTFAQN